MTIVILVVLVAAWGLVVASWWRSRTGREPFFARRNAPSRKTQSRTMLRLGILFVATGGLNLALAIWFDATFWSVVAGVLFLVAGGGLFIEATRLRTGEIRDAGTG